MNLKKNLKYLMSLVMVVIIFVSTTMIQAADLIDTTAKGSLTIQYKHNGEALSNVVFNLYQIADISPTGQYTLVEAYNAYPIDTALLEDQTQWQAMATTLLTYITVDYLAVDRTASTNESGYVAFNELTVGLYLVANEATTSNDTTITMRPFLVSLPSLNVAGTNWAYDLTVGPKTSGSGTTEGGGSSGGNDTINIGVSKVWEGQDNLIRPETITVDLYNGTTLYETVTLHTTNGWRHTWYNLPAEGNWHVVERDVPSGYTVTYDYYETFYRITNTYQEPSEPPITEEQVPEGGGGSPGEELEEFPTPEGDTPDHIIDLEEFPIPEEEVPAGPVPEPEPGKIPQTGLRLHVVLLLSLIGMICFSIGYIELKRG